MLYADEVFEAFGLTVSEKNADTLLMRAPEKQRGKSTLRPPNFDTWAALSTKMSSSRRRSTTGEEQRGHASGGSPGSFVYYLKLQCNLRFKMCFFTPHGVWFAMINRGFCGSRQKALYTHALASIVVADLLFALSIFHFILCISRWSTMVVDPDVSPEETRMFGKFPMS